jgi:hypothetical protein
MTPFRLWIALTITYAVTVVSLRLLILGAAVLDGPTLAALVAVPTAQALIITAVRRWRRRA